MDPLYIPYLRDQRPRLLNVSFAATLRERPLFDKLEDLISAPLVYHDTAVLSL